MTTLPAPITARDPIRTPGRTIAPPPTHTSEPISIALLSPGWVKTDMGGSGATLRVEESIAAMRRVIARLGPGDKGAFLDHRGKSLPW